MICTSHHAWLDDGERDLHFACVELKKSSMLDNRVCARRSTGLYSQTVLVPVAGVYYRLQNVQHWRRGAKKREKGLVSTGKSDAAMHVVENWAIIFTAACWIYCH